MRTKWITAGGLAALACVTAAPGYCASDATGIVAPSASAQMAQIVPGKSTKSDVQSLLGAPWRVVQFNDCGMAMEDQADETWEYRGNGPSGGYRIHVEFGDDGVVHLLATIPDKVRGGAPTKAQIAPETSSTGMSM